MPNQAKGSKQTEVKLLTKMTLPNQTKHNEVRLNKISNDKVRSRAKRKETCMVNKDDKSSPKIFP